MQRRRFDCLGIFLDAGLPPCKEDPWINVVGWKSTWSRSQPNPGRLVNSFASFFLLMFSNFSIEDQSTGLLPSLFLHFATRSSSTLPSRQHEASN